MPKRKHEETDEGVLRDGRRSLEEAVSNNASSYTSEGGNKWMDDIRGVDNSINIIDSTVGVGQAIERCDKGRKRKNDEGASFSMVSASDSASKYKEDVDSQSHADLDSMSLEDEESLAYDNDLNWNTDLDLLDSITNSNTDLNPIQTRLADAADKEAQEEEDNTGAPITEANDEAR